MSIKMQINTKTIVDDPKLYYELHIGNTDITLLEGDFFLLMDEMHRFVNMELGFFNNRIRTEREKKGYKDLA